MNRKSIGWLVLLSAVTSTAYAEGSWRTIDEDRGIKVTVRDEPGRELPTFRGQGNIHARILEVLAVILDIPGATRWAKGADEARLVRTIDPKTHLVYTRTDTPWPVSDRDLIMRRTVQIVKPAQEFHIRLLCAPKATAELEGVIRVRTCDSYFHLRYVDDETTFVDYQVNLDPRGSLPLWLIAWASKKIPMETLVSLEAQATKTGKQYASVVKEWATAQ